MSTYLQDPFQRRFSYLRLSLTERCSFRCGYCLPNGYKKDASAPPPLNISEIKNLVTAFAEMGTWKIRLTGGEPTERPDLIDIARTIKDIPGVKKIALSTNGQRLSKYLKDLRTVGVTQVNISIDSLDATRFAEITGSQSLPKILESIEEALSLGFTVKVNAVLLKGRNESDFESFLEYIRKRPISVRWIELMPTDQGADYFKKYHTKSDTLQTLLLSSGWQLRPREEGDGPALEYSHSSYQGRVGIIAPYSKDFCTSCNRLRITAGGALRLCLFGSSNASLRNLLQSPAQKENLKERVRSLLLQKEVSHFLPEGNYGNNATFSNIGG